MWDMFESFSLSYFWDIAEPFQIFVRTEKTYKDNYKLNHERYLSYSYKSTFSIYSSPDFVPMFCFQYLAGSNVFFFLGLFFHFRSFFLFRPFLYILSVVYQFSDVAKHSMANLNKSEDLVTNTTSASKYIPMRSFLSDFTS